MATPRTDGAVMGTGITSGSLTREMYRAVVAAAFYIPVRATAPPTVRARDDAVLVRIHRRLRGAGSPRWRAGSGDRRVRHRPAGGRHDRRTAPFCRRPAGPRRPPPGGALDTGAP